MDKDPAGRGLGFLWVRRVGFLGSRILEGGVFSGFVGHGDTNKNEW